MLKKLLFAGGAAYLTRKFLGGRSRSPREHGSRGGGLFGSGRSRPAGRTAGW
jgi:hypothetical protein